MPQIVNKKSVLEMAMGAIAEITDYEVERVVANIMDPNTAATAKRKITITLTFAPDDYRQQISRRSSRCAHPCASPRRGTAACCWPR